MSGVLRQVLTVQPQAVLECAPYDVCLSCYCLSLPSAGTIHMPSSRFFKVIYLWYLLDYDSYMQ